MLAVDRFIWTPLQNRTGRKIPGSIRSFTSLIILLFALFGILAFVFNQQLTSLLATSGLLTMIIGLGHSGQYRQYFLRHSAQYGAPVSGRGYPENQRGIRAKMDGSDRYFVALHQSQRQYGSMSTISPMR